MSFASILDCESYDSALKTSAALLGRKPDELLRALRRFEYEKVTEPERRLRPYEDLLIRHSIGITPDDLPAPPLVYWFHATRVPPGTDFREGILSLSDVLDRVWQLLGELASDWSTSEEWANFRQGMKGDGALQYSSKLAYPGPYGFLIRDVIFRPSELRNHDFLGIPEIVEDICLSYDEMFGKQLRQRYLDFTRPCIVKFGSELPRPDALASALAYIHAVSRGGDLPRWSNNSFSGEGVSISPEAIVRIEWPEPP